MDRRLLLMEFVLGFVACACSRANAEPQAWDPIDAKFKGCEGG